MPDFFKRTANTEQAPTPAEKFLSNAPKNTALALVTVPSEALALRRIFDRLSHPQNKAVSYANILKNIGPGGLCKGALSRTGYCLTGNFATLQGVHYFGSDYQGLFLTTLAKNMILPVFLTSNARQIGYNAAQTFTYVAKGVIDPVIHSSFFFRNLVANSCLLPGFMVRDYCHQAMDETHTQIPTLLGLSTSVVLSTAINAFLKPFFTGNYPVNIRWATAVKMPGVLPLIMRELCSLSLVFFNTSAKEKRTDDPVKEEQTGNRVRI